MKWLFYRKLMKLSHHFNWHHTRTIYPDGDTMLICDWCGLRYVSKRAGYRDMVSVGVQTLVKADAMSKAK